MIDQYVGGGNTPRFALKAEKPTWPKKNQAKQMMPSKRTQPQGRRKENEANCRVAYANYLYVSLATFDVIFF